MFVEPIVFIIDDDKEMRGALRYLIESVGIQVEEFDEPRSFLSSYNGHRPACFVVDMRMPFMSGLDLLDILNKKAIDAPVIIITGHGDVPSAVRALQSGAVDYLEKPFNSQVMLDRIQRCLENDAAKLTANKEKAKINSRFARLTPREQEVLEQVVSGMPNKKIANELNISLKTVEIHRAHVMEKTGAQNLVELLSLYNSTQN